jgi:exosortase/archaeosortase family protein
LKQFTKSSLTGPYWFSFALFAFYVLPAVIPGLGVDYPFLFTVGVILLAWLIIRWNRLKVLKPNDSIFQIAIGLALAFADLYINFLYHSNLGLIDMLAIFIGLTIAFYGVRSTKFFLVPYLYLGVLIVGYQLENTVPQLKSLEDALAGLMAVFMNILGVKATLYSYNIVELSRVGGADPIFLQVDGPCTGLKGIIAFGLLSSLALLDTRPRIKQLLLLLSIGFLGAFMINIARLAVVFVTFEYLGNAAGSLVHVYLGYTLFIAWVFAFWSIAFRYILTHPASSNVNVSSHPSDHGRVSA